MGEPYTSAAVADVYGSSLCLRPYGVNGSLVDAFFEGKICDLCKVVVYLQGDRVMWNLLWRFIQGVMH
jgi:hypothetical protein